MKLIFSTTKYQYILDNILEHQNISNNGVLSSNDLKIIKEGSIIRKIFPDGESYHKLEKVAGKQIILIGGTISDTETLELYDMACHIVKNGAKSLTIIIPYFGYSTMERAVESGEIVKAKTRARLISSIPSTSHVKILFMDLHSEGIPHYLEGGIQPVHMYVKTLIIEMCRKISIKDEKQDWKTNTDFILASTDAGRAKWVESLSNEMGVDCAIITKRRQSGTDTSIVGINANVKGKKVVIYDDMIRTGGSLINAGQAYKNAGASSVFAVATHGVLPGESIFKLKTSGVFDKIFVTNTHPQTNFYGNTPFPSLKDFIEVFDISPILYKYLQNKL